MGRACVTHGSDNKHIQNFGRKFEGKRPLGRIRRRWENDIRMDLTKIMRKV